MPLTPSVLGCSVMVVLMATIVLLEAVRDGFCGNGTV